MIANLLDRLNEYSLGPSAQVLIRNKSLGKDVASLTLSHGDILYFPNCWDLANEFEVRGHTFTIKAVEFLTRSFLT